MSHPGPAGPRWSLRPVEDPRARRRLLVRRGLRVAAGVLAALTALLGALTAYASLTLPSVDGIGRATGTIRVFDRGGALIAEIDHDQRTRSTVPLAAIAPVMRSATLAAEDRHFYDEGAIDYGRVVRALLVDVVARRADQGGSTITQQLAKLAFLSPDRSALRKLREALLANQIGQRYTKDQILELYLNLVDYGEGAHGVEDASQRYFGVHAGELDLRRATLLAGLPQAPALNDPLLDPRAAFGRQHYVLGGLVAMQVVGAAQAAEVDPLADDPAIRGRNQAVLLEELRHGRSPAPTAAPHAVALVRAELDGLLADQPAALQGNLDVTTTLDLTVQTHAQQAVHDGVARIGHGADNGALVMLDPHTGDVVALVGSADFADAAIAGQYDVATGLRRPGSTFKPIVYATAFAEGRLNPDSKVDDTAAESARLGGVQDVDRSFLGRMSVRDALLGSRNVPAEQAMEMAGVGAVIDTAHAMGITTELAPNASTAIGTSAVRPLDLAAAYGALAADGMRVLPRLVTQVTDGAGDLLVAESAPAPSTRVLPSAAVQQVDGILAGYSTHWGLPFDRPTAGKSGTTDANVDAWYVAYTPDWVVTAWAGHTDGASPAEVGMDGVGGNDVATSVVAPFVRTLPRSGAWFQGLGQPGSGGGGGSSGGDQGGD